MAALIIVMSVAAVMMTVAMPTWKQMSRREKEEELIFRGQQYVRAIRLYGQKFANANPPNIDVLVEQRFIRRKFKDPITNDDFLPILAGQAVPGSSTPGQTAQRGSGPAAIQRGPDAPPISSGGQQGGRGGTTGGPGAQGPVGGVMGVMSKSKDESIRLYNGRSHYNEWAFVYVAQVQAPGAGAPGAGVPGQRGRGGQQGQPPGTNPFGSGIGGERGRGGPGRGQPPPGGGPGRGFGPPTSPFQPATPIQPGRGRGF